MSAAPQGAFVVIPEISCSDISYIINSDLRNGGYLRRAGCFLFCLVLLCYQIYAVKCQHSLFQHNIADIDILVLDRLVGLPVKDVIHDRYDQQGQRRRVDQSADAHQRDRLHHIGAGGLADRHDDQPQDRRQAGHQYRTLP